MLGIEDVSNFFLTYFTIYHGNTMVYHDSKVINGITRASNETLTFKPFEPKSTGTYSLQIFTRLKNDNDLNNDTLHSSFYIKAKRDMVALNILPSDLSNPLQVNQDVLNLSTQIMNDGTDLVTDSCTVILEISRDGNLIRHEEKKALPGNNDTDTVIWSSFTPQDPGLYSVTSWCNLANDEVKSNDTTISAFEAIATHEVSVLSITSPADKSKLKVNDTLKMQALIANNGEQDEQVPVVFALFKETSSQPVFTDSKTINLASKQQVSVAANPHIMAWSGSYIVRVYVDLGSDQIRKNDTAEVVFTIDKTNNLHEAPPVDLTVYPNPSNGLYYTKDVPLNDGKLDVFVHNALGQDVSFTVGYESGNLALSLLNQPAGLYYLHVITESKTYIVKLIKR